MADIVLTSAANWSICKSGGAPAAGDSIYLNGTFALTLDGADNATYTCVLIRACVSASDTTGKSGTITLGAETTTCTLNCNLWAGSTTLLAIASGKHVTVTGTCTGSLATTGITACSVLSGGYLDSVGTAQGGSATQSYGVNCAGTITACTNAIGGGGNFAYGIYLNAGTITSITDAIGGSVANAHGISMNSTAVITSCTEATGGSLYGAHGVNTGTAGTCTVASAKGGSVQGALGVLVGANGSGGTVTINSTDISGVGLPVGFIGTLATLRMAAGTVLGSLNGDGSAVVLYAQLPDIVNPAKVLEAENRYPGDATPGTYHEATVAEVQAGVMFGAGSALEGTYAGGGGAVVGPFEIEAFR
jgi:hypothetical protein